MTEHDEFCRCTDASWSSPVWCSCDKIRAIRTDERERMTFDGWVAPVMKFDGWVAPEAHEAIVATAAERARRDERERIAQAIFSIPTLQVGFIQGIAIALIDREAAARIARQGGQE